MQERKRHGLLTLWLVLVIGANFLEALRHYILQDEIREIFPEAPEWVFVVLLLAGAANVVFGIALFLWKKWAFWGLLCISLLQAVLYIYLGVGLQALVFVLVVVVLYFVLQLGGEQRGWYQLE